MSLTKAKTRVIVVDDDTDMLELIGDFLRSKGRHSIGFSDPAEAFDHLKSLKDSNDLLSIDCIVSDIQMPRLTGNELLLKLKRHGIDIPLLFATAFGSVESAIECMRQGAFDYIVKPFRLGDLEVKIEKATSLRQAHRENIELRKAISEGTQFAGLIGRSPPMKALFAKIEQIAPTHAPVLILGEAGTGKELVARAIHSLSTRRDGPFVSFNCALMPSLGTEEALLGAEVSPRNSQKIIGALDSAASGTLFLEDICDLNLDLQAKLLQRLLATDPLAENNSESTPTAARLICSSHKDLARGITEGWFRRELFYRINVIPLQTPTLRERREDIGPLADHFLRRACLLNHFEVKRLDSSARQLLSRQSWPGNVRQLQNLMERLAVLLPEDRITAEELEELTSPGITPTNNESWFAKLMSLAELEKEYIQFVLKQTQGRKEEAARILGINRRTLYRKERDYDLISPK